MLKVKAMLGTEGLGTRDQKWGVETTLAIKQLGVGRTLESVVWEW